ncbi:13770_t:CDS:2 [Ambispora leptoticha]|uniref:13770_t:CDS:1 n=1 Tax=Ambispora leptoticha TaxID=144679 RepID=A0A9N9ACL4_9GLOM|nr:13770_t:CDS:2 [Ambispora leptoticha]
MIHTLHSRNEVLDILHCLEITDNNAIFSKFKHLHGLLVLKAYLIEWRQDDEIVLKVYFRSVTKTTNFGSKYYN